jgi:hypothetical protein
MQKRTRKVPKSNPQSNRIKVTTVPIEQAYTISQTGNDSVSRFRATDIISSFVISPSTVGGQLYEFPLDPTIMRGRVSALAKNFQEFRFTRAVIRIANNFATTVGGGYIIAYTSNPDQLFSADFDTSSAQLFALKPSSSQPWYIQGVTGAQLTPGKWFTLDNDSDEKMLTTQGKFLLKVTSIPTVSAATTVQVFLDYDVEFRHPAIQEVITTQQAYVFPACTWTNFDINSFTATIVAGEPNFSLPTYPNWEIIPGLVVTATGGEFDPLSVQALRVVAVTSPSVVRFELYKAVGDIGTADVVNSREITANFTTPRATVEALNK